MCKTGGLILASSSPRRRQILERLGLGVEVRFPKIEEKRLNGESPADYASRIAEEKALDVARSLKVSGQGPVWVIGADTVVVVDGKPLGKPKDEDHGRRMLRELSGRDHTVMTGWIVLDAVSGKKEKGVEQTRVWFKKLRDQEIEAYGATGEGLDKAGAYGIQGVGCFLVERIEGNYENVVGLPVCPLIEALENLGVVPVFPVDTEAPQVDRHLRGRTEGDKKE